MSALTATSLYGYDPTSVRPTPTPAPDHMGGPEQTMATTGPASKGESPLVALMVILGLVVLLTQVSFRGTVAVRA